MNVTSGVRYFSLTAVLFTATAKFIFFDFLQMQFWFIMGAGFFWLAYLIYFIRTDKEQLTEWGFRKEGFRESILLLWPFALAAVVLFAVYGYYSGKMIVSWHIFLSLLMYPIWGIAQQFIILGLVAGNLRNRLPLIWVILITALLFSAVHFPNYWLMGGTLILALVYTNVYLKYNNLWALGIIHGWLGSFFYFFILGKDAWLSYINSF